jgi:hypothetical protein
MKYLATIVTVLFYIISISAQSKTSAGLTDDEINQLSSNLAMKILLNETQETSVSNLLKTYRSDLTLTASASIQETQNKLISATNEKIIALLDSKQKMKFNVVSPDWWKSIQEAQAN